MKNKIDWFPYQLTAISIILFLGIYFSIKFHILILTIILFVLLLFILLAFSGYIFSSISTERSILEFLKANNGQLPIGDIENYFHANPKISRQNAIGIANKAIRRLKNKNQIVIENSIIKLNV